jgi:hypothetical protein
MAILTDSDYSEMRDRLYSVGQGKEQLKAHPVLPNESQLRAAFQSIEDSWEANRAAMKSALDGALGVTTTAIEARFFFAAWIVNKLRRGM